MKLVAVSQRVDEYPDRNEKRDALDQKLVQFLIAAGYLPVPIPNTLYPGNNANQDINSFIEHIKPDAFVLSGGNDIGSCKDRDFTESTLLDYSNSNRLPVLGICRGMQMMAVYAGASLKAVSGHVKTRHILTGEISTDCNSYHNQVITECPDNFSILAQSEDGEIEAIRHNNLAWEGWMWHPEREFPFKDNDLTRLKTLFG